MIKLAKQEESTEEAAEDTDAIDPVDPVDAELSPAQKLEHEHYEQIRDMTNEVCDARTKWATAKDRASGLKKNFDALNGELIDMIRRGPDLQQKLPLADGEKAADGGAAAVPNDAWREVEVGELGIADSLVAKLLENDLETLGDLDKFWKARKSLTDIKGIGAAKADQVSDAYAKYGTEHPELFGTAASVATDEAPADESAEEDDDEEEEDEDSEEGSWEDEE